MQENVITLPKITDQSLLAEYYSMADAFVICSKKKIFRQLVLKHNAVEHQ